MSKKTSAAKRAAFLRALAKCGNQTIAAERAKVSRSWVCQHRSRDAGFDAECRAAIEQANARLLRGAKSNSPPSGWGYLDGAELVVRGTGGSGGGKRIQIARAREKQWTARAEARFLKALAGTCNVKAACSEVGMWPPSGYNHRKRWPGFAEKWEAAEETGFVRIETALIAEACNLFSKSEIEPEIAIEGMTVWHALQLLHMHRHQVRGTGGRPGLPPRHAASNKQIAEALRKRLKSFTAWRQRPPSEAEMKAFRREVDKRKG